MSSPSWKSEAPRDYAARIRLQASLLIRSHQACTPSQYQSTSGISAAVIHTALGTWRSHTALPILQSVQR